MSPRVPAGGARGRAAYRGGVLQQRIDAVAAVFEGALAGVEAGRAGRFGSVVGVVRVGQAEQLRAHGANLVVRDLAEILESP
ncbi:hypothetical protein [Streptomyces collinus]